APVVAPASLPVPPASAPPANVTAPVPVPAPVQPALAPAANIETAPSALQAAMPAIPQPGAQVEDRAPSGVLPDALNDADKILNQAQDKTADGPDQGTQSKSIDELLAEVQPTLEGERVSALHAAEGSHYHMAETGAVHVNPNSTQSGAETIAASAAA